MLFLEFIHSCSHQFLATDVVNILLLNKNKQNYFDLFAEIIARYKNRCENDQFLVTVSGGQQVGCTGVRSSAEQRGIETVGLTEKTRQCVAVVCPVPVLITQYTHKHHQLAPRPHHARPWPDTAHNLSLLSP